MFVISLVIKKCYKFYVIQNHKPGNKYVYHYHIIMNCQRCCDGGCLTSLINCTIQLLANIQ